MGTPEFAVPSLEALIRNDENVVAVITAPDKPQGRGQKIVFSPVKTCALKYNIPVLQPTNLKSPDFVEELRSFRAELQVVVAFRMLPEVVWSMPPRGTFNLHASLLPQYRGAAPINWAIINGEKESGVTTFFLQHDIDTGNIILQETEPIHEDDDAGTLYEKLMLKGADLVVRTVKAIRAGDVTATPQPAHSTVRHAPKIFRETCEINWEQPGESVRNFVRGLSPYPAAWTTIGGKVYKIYRTALVSFTDDTRKPGEYVTDRKNYLYFKTADKWIAIEELQPEGKKRMAIGDFLRGNTL